MHSSDTGDKWDSAPTSLFIDFNKSYDSVEAKYTTLSLNLVHILN